MLPQHVSVNQKDRHPDGHKGGKRKVDAVEEVVFVKSIQRNIVFDLTKPRPLLLCLLERTLLTNVWIVLVVVRAEAECGNDGEEKHG